MRSRLKIDVAVSIRHDSSGLKHDGARTGDGDAIDHAHIGAQRRGYGEIDHDTPVIRPLVGFACHRVGERISSPMANDQMVRVALLVEEPSKTGMAS